MSELREWIIEHGVDVRKLREEARDKGAVDSGDYLHWLEREVLMSRLPPASSGTKVVRASIPGLMLGTPEALLNDGNEETQS